MNGQFSNFCQLLVHTAHVEEGVKPFKVWMTWIHKFRHPYIYFLNIKSASISNPGYYRAWSHFEFKNLTPQKEDCHNKLMMNGQWWFSRNFASSSPTSCFQQKNLNHLTSREQPLNEFLDSPFSQSETPPAQWQTSCSENELSSLRSPESPSDHCSATIASHAWSLPIQHWATSSWQISFK